MAEADIDDSNGNGIDNSDLPTTDQHIFDNGMFFAHRQMWRYRYEILFRLRSVQNSTRSYDR